MTIKQYVLDALGKFWTKLKSTYVTNCASTSNNLALAASQGKVLQDQITALNSSYNALSNYSGYPKVRYYNASNPINCNELPTGWALAVATGGNYPTSSGLYWVNSLAYAVNNDGSVNTGIQIAYVYDSNAEARYFRKVTSNTWSAWQLQPRKTDIDELNSKTVSSTYFNSGNPLTISASSNSVFILYGFVQGIASGGLFVITVINSEVRIFDIGTNTQITSILSGSYSNNVLTLQTTNAAASRVVLSRA